MNATPDWLDGRTFETEELARIEVRLLGLPTRRALTAAHSDAPSTDAGPDDRQLVVVGIEDADGAVGWGECSALNAPTYTSEWAADSFERLAAWAEGGTHPDMASHPMTSASIEMAFTDLVLRTTGTSLASALGAGRPTVRAGAALGLAPVDTSVALARDLVEAGYRKLKVKIGPSQVDDVAHELSHAFEGRDDDPVEIHVDANGSLGEAHLMALAGLTYHGVSVIEQPFSIERSDLAAELMLGTEAVVVADEAVTTVADADALLAAGAVRGVAIKPPRVGGIAKAIELLRWCDENGIGASVGGMLECGLGRHALAALAALDGFTITGDLSPASQWLTEDPWPDIEMNGADIVVPTTPGIAPLPDLDCLDRFTLRRVEARWPSLRSPEPLT